MCTELLSNPIVTCSVYESTPKLKNFRRVLLALHPYSTIAISKCCILNVDSFHVLHSLGVDGDRAQNAQNLVTNISRLFGSIQGVNKWLV